MKGEFGPLLGASKDLAELNRAKPVHYYGQDMEEYLDLNFGVGCWVRDPFEDKYVVWTGDDGGPSYLIIDRDFRRWPVTIPHGRVH